MRLATIFGALSLALALSSAGCVEAVYPGYGYSYGYANGYAAQPGYYYGAQTYYGNGYYGPNGYAYGPRYYGGYPRGPAPVVVGPRPVSVVVARPSGPVAQPVAPMNFGGGGIHGGPAMHFGRR